MNEILNERWLQMRGRELKLGERTLIMGILNITPDSFSDGGTFMDIEKALDQARRLVAEGADMLDIGGESTRPGAQPVTAEEEMARVIPVIEAVAGEIDIPISIDTYKAETARRALEAGAHIINDVWGCKKDRDMAQVAADSGAPIILMHNREEANYEHFLTDVIRDLEESMDMALQAGVQREQIILDPGFGFAKDMEQNLYLMNHLHVICELGYPVLLGTSRKRMIRHILQRPVDDVVEGTAVTTVMGIEQGCSIIRVHDVKQMRRTADMTDAILRRKDGVNHG
ncbi:dihydropteroate synthase [Marinicrinis sediminis]|uniref:Dihydropteroate synthase n=1 Tax=Marinicrinis sediminis TaxID=1652465 RepID=A0ABW5R9T5_9BACL